MSVETEAKFQVASHDPIRDRLRTKGATFLHQVLERNRIYDRPDGSLRNQGCGLRLRVAARVDNGESHATITFKGPVLKGPVKSREEIEFPVPADEAPAHFIEGLGFVVVLDYDKHRESWLFSNCQIELDQPPHIGLFVEIEGPDVETIGRAQRALGLSDSEYVRESYVRLLTQYCEDRGIFPRVLRQPPKMS
ncbi:MAG: class IV adenylate cyclase [Planctomycetota bacterium]